MKIITPAKVSWTEHQEPFAESFNDCYFSAPDSEKNNGFAETQHVFIEGNRLAERWQQLQNDTFVIGETGFGTGLNFIAAWQLWNDTAPVNAHLTFISAELHPLRKDDLIKAASLWPELKSLYAQLIAHYPSLTPGFHTLNFECVTLVLLLGDATSMFGELLKTDHPDFSDQYGCKFDAWFLDGFAPAKNPQLWTNALLQTIAQLSGEATSLATFSAAGEMRRTLETVGFQVKKQNGFANKREMVTATFQKNAEIQQHNKSASMIGRPVFVSSPYITPWYINKKCINREYIDKKYINQQQKKIEHLKTVSIIGAGIAGCTLAYALARKGFKVTVIDEQDKVASGASGNQQAVLYSKFSSDEDEFAQFNLATYLYALRFYRKLLKENSSLAIHLCGVLQLAWSDDEQQVQNSLQDFFSQYPDIAQPVTREQASDIAGVSVETGGLFFADAGWINPASICEQLLQHANITTVFNQRITALHHENNQWQLLSNTDDANKSPAITSTHVVISNGHQCQQFEQSRYLPLKFIRGQVTHVEPTTISQQLKTVICGDGYIAPAENNHQSFGATYTPSITELKLTTTDHQINLEHLAKSSGVLSQQWTTNNGITGGRAHVRTATPDYFPVCGPLPNEADFLNTYAPLRKNANANILEAGSYHPNLYVFAGLGSRGMTYAPLCAEVLSNLINGNPLTLPRNVTQHLNPARFIIRDLIKNRI